MMVEPGYVSVRVTADRKTVCEVILPLMLALLHMQDETC